MLAISLASLLLGLSSVSGLGQTLLSTKPTYSGLAPAGTFTASKSLHTDGAVSCHTHQAIPSDLELQTHRVHIKSHDTWCDPHARSYTGYIDTGFGNELFFYFFESRSQPETDPVVMWINGGPGGSSAMGLFMEQGELGEVCCRATHACRTLSDQGEPQDRQ
jgi:carboxypeptidase C (cathepsin A)